MQPDYKLFTIILGVVSLILFIILILLIIFNASLQQTQINSSQIPTLTGAFGVNPNREAPGYKACGSTGGELCVFTGIFTLSQAIDTCNSQNSICQGFNYYPASAIIVFTDPTNSVTSVNSSSDYYARQVPVMIVS